MEKNYIEFRNVYKKYDNSSKYAVEGVSLSIDRGEFVVILGASGSGKTTLLKSVNRLNSLTSGSIYLDGKDITEESPTDLRKKIGYVIQQNGLFPHMTVENNIKIIPKLLKWDKERIKNRIKELMELVDLDYNAYRRRFPRQLSGGEQQRVGLARALAADPEILLMDEPFGAVDAITRNKLQDELLSLQSKVKKTILFVTHDIQEAFKLADRIIIMNNGKVQQYDDSYNILFKPASEYVRKLFASENFLDRLQAVKAKYVMSEPDERLNTITCEVDSETNLKEIYQLFIVNDCDAVRVNDCGKIIRRDKINRLTKSILNGDKN